MFLRRVSVTAVAIGAAILGAAAATAGALPTSVPGTVSVAAPPAGFSPLTAGAETLAAYGFPDRPDAARAPAAFAAWSNAMLRARRRIVPALVPSHIRHLLSAASLNWSGGVLSDAVPSWGPGSFEDSWAIFAVPTVARPPASTCKGWLYSSQWTGMDGVNANDVVQAGVDSDSYCTATRLVPNYEPWYEWYPAYTVYITNFAVKPKDMMVVIVKALSATLAAFYVEDETTGDYVSLQSAAPAGTVYVGNSAEWITERPEINNKLANLANYGSETYTAFAFNTAGVMSSPGAPAAGLTATVLTMLDNNNYPISLPSLPASNEVATVVTGSAK